MIMEKERELIVEYGKRMSKEGLSRGTAGNISIYNEELGLMAISPSGIGYFETTPEDVVLMTLDGEIRDGSRKPSSEAGMHAAFYQAKLEVGCRAIVHTHSDYATTLACMGEPIRAVHYAIASAGTDLIPVAPYTTFGTPELAKLAVETCREGRAVLLGNHGLIAFGINIEKAFSLAGSLESLAKTQWQCMCAGKMNVLTKEQMEDVFVRFQSYGQKKPAEGSSNSY